MSPDTRALLIEARTELFALCENTLDGCADALTAPGLERHELGYLRGRKVEAKAIARAMGDVFRDLLGREPPEVASWQEGSEVGDELAREGSASGMNPKGGPA